MVYKVCKTEQSASRQRDLEQGLLAAMGSRHYDEITVSDLCAQIGIPRKSFYRYFSGKEGALHALLDHTMMEYESFAVSHQQGKQRTVQQDLEGFFLFWQERKTVLDALKRSALSGVLVERAIAHAVSETVLPSRFLPMETKEMQTQTVMFCICGLMSMMLNWHHEGFPLPASQMARFVARMLSQPLYPGADAPM